MTKQLKIGIIGLGKMGKIRAKTIRENRDTTLICGTDPFPPDPPAREFEGMQIYKDADAVIGSDADAIIVATPNRFIPDAVINALDAGKHVFAEKPPGRNMEDIERIIEAERRNPGLVLKFGFNHRYHFGIMEAKKIVDSGTYGKILWMRGTYGKGEYMETMGWRQDPEIVGGGILLDQGIHMLDLFCHFGRSKFIEIKSMCTTAYWNIPMEDNAFAILRDTEGRIAMLHSSFNQWKHRFTLEIFMSDGYVIVDGMASTTRSYRDEWLIHGRKHTGYAIGNPPETSTFCNTDPSWEMELADFVDCISNNRPVENGNSEDAYESMRLVYSIYNNDELFIESQKQKLLKMNQL